MKNLVLLTLLLLCTLQLVAQDSSITRQEIWPEIDLYYRFNEKFRLYAKYSATKLRNSDYTDGGFGIYMDYFASPLLKDKQDTSLRESARSHYLWFRLGYMYSTSPPEAKDPFNTNTIVTEINGSIYLPYEILLTNKNRIDWTIKDENFEPRYRPRLTFEKHLHTKYLYFTPDIYGEYYVYFNRSGLNRFRLSAGIQTKFTDNIEWETYYVHQFANGKYVESLNAIGLSLKFYFMHKKGGTKSSGKNKSGQ